MAITITKSGENAAGALRQTYGKYVISGGATGGDINTGLHQVVTMSVVATGSSIVADAPTINETFPCDGSAVTIIGTQNTSGYWVAWGW